MPRTTRHPILISILVCIISVLLLASNSASTVLAAPTAAATPTNLGPFSAPNLPLDHDQTNGDTVIQFDLSHLAQFSSFSLKRVRLNFEWQATGGSFGREARITLLSPDGTSYDPGKLNEQAQFGEGVLNVELPHFFAEAFAGTWTVTLSDTFDDAGNDFRVDALSLTLLGEEIEVANYGMLGWWPLDNSNPGLLMQDHSGHNNDAYPVGDPAYNKGRPLSYSDKQGSFDFDGDDYFQVPNNGGQLDSDTLTLTAWVRHHGSTDAAQKGLFSMRGPDGIRFVIDRQQGNGAFLVYNGSGSAFTTGAAFFPANTWVHMAVVFGESDTKVYKNGVLTMTLAGYQQNLATTAQDFYIGRNANLILDGQLSDVRLYDRALSVAEVAALGKASWTGDTFSGGDRFGHAAVADGEHDLLVFGGYGDGSTLDGDAFDGINTAQRLTFNAFHTGVVTNLAPMNQARRNPEAIRLQNGKILIVGGCSDQSCTPFVTNNAANLEIYDPSNNTWTLGPAYKNSHMTVTELADGRVLIVGGRWDNGTTSYIFDPDTSALTAIADPLNTGRAEHTATLLPDGKVLVVGGFNNSAQETDSAELFDPATNQWTPTGTSVGRHARFTANLVSVNGVDKVAILGGTFSGGQQATLELYDIATGTFSVAIPADPRLDISGHRTVTLPDGTLLITGGYTFGTINDSRKAVLHYQPENNSLKSHGDYEMTHQRSSHTANILGDGRVAIFSGANHFDFADTGETLFAVEGNYWADAFLRAFQTSYGIDYRANSLQDNCNADYFECDARPAAMGLAQDFSEYEAGEFYWQFCADYGDPVFDSSNAGDGVQGLADTGLCPEYDDLTTAQKNLRYNGAFSNSKSNSLRNYLVDFGLDYHAAATLLPSQYQHNGGGTAQATGVINETVREVVTIHTLFGNEFLLKALRLPDDLNTLSDDQLINRKLEQLRRASHQYSMATKTVLDVANLRVGGVDDSYMIELLDAETLSAFTFASERQIAALEEIIRVEQILGNQSDEALLLEIAETVATQNAQILLLADLFGTIAPDDGSTSDNETAEAFVEIGGDMLINNIGRLSQLTELIRSGLNPLGYDPEFVPLRTTEDLLAFVCGSGNTSCTGAIPGGLIGAALAAQNDYIASTEQYNQNQAVLGDDLFAIHQEAKSELTALCGGSGVNGDSWDTCDAGLMEQNRLDFIAANQAAAIAWERAEQIKDLIEIEENLAQITIEAIDSTSKTLFAYELAIGKLEAYKTTSTDFTSSSETETKSVEASVTASVKASVNAGFPPGGGVEASVEVAATAAIGKDWETSKGSTTETSVDVNAAKIGKFNGMSQLREAEKEATIVGAESSAEVQRLLLEQSTLLLEYELSLVDINKVMAEHNHLVDEFQLLKDQLAASEEDAYGSYANEPYFRILKDRKAQVFEEKLRIAIHYAYLTAKSFEYVTLEPLDGSNGVDLSELYKVQSAAGLQEVMTDIANAHFGLNLGLNKTREKVSFAINILGLTDEVIQGDTSATLTPAEIVAERNARFQQYVTDHTVNGKVIIDFATMIDLPVNAYFPFDKANLRISGADNTSAGCDGGVSCSGFWLNVVTDQTLADLNNERPDVLLTHAGHANYRRNSGEYTTYRPGPTRIIDAPSTFDSIDRKAAMTAHINMSSDPLTDPNLNLIVSDFQNLSVATSRWRLEIVLANNPNFDMSQFNDFELRMDAVGFTVARSAEVAAADAVRLAAVQQGKPVPQDALAIVENWQAEQAASPSETRSDASRAVQATPAFTLTNETYTGRMFTLAPIALDSTSAGFELFFNSDNTITGTLCAYCSAGYENDVAVTGSWESASITPTFSIETALFADVNGVLSSLTLNGDMQTRSRDLTVPDAPFVYAPFSGDPADGVQFLLGTFSETISGIGAEAITRSGDFILTPPTADFVDSAAAPTAVSLANGSAAAQPYGVTLLLFVAALVGTALSTRRKRQHTIN